jgi:pimeloyl-ACP methyl ester carboxylesterase
VLRWSAIATALLLGLGLVGVPEAQARVAAEPIVSSVAWKTCTDPELQYYELQCGTLEVPLDRADPTGSKVRLALTRKVHTAAYRGVLLINPGGPGGSGLTMPVLSDYVPGGAGASYDWIGFDPRGVGASSPSLHCNRGYFGYDRPSYVPTKARILNYWLAKNRSYATACANTAAKRKLISHLTTLDTVLDMEAIRQALGAEKISYYGFSYGTYLGQVYASRFPTRVDRMILDGVVDPHRVWYAANLGQDVAFDANMDEFWRYVGRHRRAFHLGKQWKAIEKGYYRTLRKLDRKPAAAGRLGPAETADVLLDAAYFVHNWDSLGAAYSDLVRHGRGRALLELYRESETGDDNAFAVYSAVQCTDAPWPGFARVRQDTQAVHRRAPFTAWNNTWYNAPCLFWKAPAQARLRVSGAAVASKVLLISETRDAATPYAGALAVRDLFPSASLVAGLGGTTHSSSLSGVGCVDNAVAGYLRTGIVPTRLSGRRADRSCPKVLPPQPWKTYSSRAQGDGAGSVDRMPPMLRHDLTAATRGR